MVLITHAERLATLEAGHRELREDFADYRRVTQEYQDSSNRKLDEILEKLRLTDVEKQAVDMTNKARDQIHASKVAGRFRIIKRISIVIGILTASISLFIAILKASRWPPV